MKLCVIGTGYVGLPTGVVFANFGNSVVCVDKVKEKVKLLNDAVVPIYEPGLKELFESNIKAQRIKFTTELREAADCNIYFICVGTPSSEEGEAELSYVYEAAKEIAPFLKNDDIIALKSTVPPGTTRKIHKTIEDELQKLKKDIKFHCAFLPEFLKQGKAVEDTLHPDRVVIGTDDPYAAKKLRRLYKPYFRKTERILEMNIESAELVKYAANCMLASRISFMNELARVCEKVGGDIEDVRKGVGTDNRIGPAFLYAGIGYGGSCFPKDVKAMIHTFESLNMPSDFLRAVKDINDSQYKIITDKISKFYNGNINGKTFCLWGLAFKPETDDIREAPALKIIKYLIDNGAVLKAHDPKAVDNVKKYFQDTKYFNAIEFCENQYVAAENVDALLLITQWVPYLSPDLEFLSRNIKDKVIFDGRNQYSKEELAEIGFKYFCIGREKEL